MVTGQTHFLSPQTPPHTHLSHHLHHISYSHALHWSAAKHFACNSRYLQLHPFMHKTSKVHASCTFSAYHHFHSTPRAGEVGYIQRCFKPQKRLEPLQLTQCLHRDVGAWERQGRLYQYARVRAGCTIAAQPWPLVVLPLALGGK